MKGISFFESIRYAT